MVVPSPRPSMPSLWRIRTITRVWQAMVVMESLWGRMVGRSTSSVSMDWIVALMGAPDAGSIVIAWQSDCSGKTEPILFGCPAIPRRYHGAAPSEVLLRGRGGAQLHLCGRATAHVSAAFIQADQAVGAGSGGRPVRTGAARPAPDAHGTVLSAACPADPREGGRHGGGHPPHGAKQARAVRHRLRALGVLRAAAAAGARSATKG